jgi:predicted  nucleic acid-binding Zn-ribbon protein
MTTPTENTSKTYQNLSHEVAVIKNLSHIINSEIERITKPELNRIQSLALIISRLLEELEATTTKSQQEDLSHEVAVIKDLAHSLLSEIERVSSPQVNRIESLTANISRLLGELEEKF